MIPLWLVCLGHSSKPDQAVPSHFLNLYPVITILQNSPQSQTVCLIGELRCNMSLCQEYNTRTKCTECKLIMWDGSGWIDCGFGEGRDRRRANSGDRGEKKERKEHVRRRRRSRRDMGCSHRQAHSSCSACWDVPGSVLHNTITACSGALCSARLCSDSVPLPFSSVPSLLFSLLACFLLCSVLYTSVQWRNSLLSSVSWSSSYH